MTETFSTWDQITDEQRELQERTRRFVDEWLIPREEQAERAGGRLPDDVRAAIRDAAIAAKLHGGRHAVEDGGQGWSTVDYMVVQEQFGRNTNGVSWIIPDAYNVLSVGSPEQKPKHLAPSLTGEAHLSYAVTEAEAGSDPSGIPTIAQRDGDDWVINGEKWFVTSGDMATAHIVVARTSEDDDDPRPPCSSSTPMPRVCEPSMTRSSLTPTATGIPRSLSRTFGFGRRRAWWRR